MNSTRINSCIHFYSYYTLRWRSANSTVWEARADVFPSSGSDLCDEGGGSDGDSSRGFGRSDPYERRVCHTVTGLQTGKDYVFQVRTMLFLLHKQLMRFCTLLFLLLQFLLL